MKLICAAFGIAAMCAAGVGAQTKTVTDVGQRKIEVKDGKKITVTGCLERNPGGGYMLTNDEGGMKYDLVTNKDLANHVGHRVSIRGKATDQGDAKLKIESKVGTTGVAGDDKTAATATTEMKGDMGLKYLGVDSVKVLSKSCM
ncbi:MAG TPA: DUF5818 domain-containing protein [Vicinamibacterales bacterium]|nr:DUF5818 domain-containing protein [Vicinamibacterales bacterium]